MRENDTTKVYLDIIKDAIAKLREEGLEVGYYIKGEPSPPYIKLPDNIEDINKSMPSPYTLRKHR